MSRYPSARQERQVHFGVDRGVGGKRHRGGPAGIALAVGVLHIADGPMAVHIPEWDAALSGKRRVLLAQQARRHDDALRTGDGLFQPVVRRTIRTDAVPVEQPQPEQGIRVRGILCRIRRRRSAGQDGHRQAKRQQHGNDPLSNSIPPSFFGFSSVFCFYSTGFNPISSNQKLGNFHFSRRRAPPRTSASRGTEGAAPGRVTAMALARVARVRGARPVSSPRTPRRK